MAKDAKGHGSEKRGVAQEYALGPNGTFVKSGQAHVVELARQHGISGPATVPSFREFASRRFGSKYVIARPTEKNKARYPEHTFITPKMHDQAKEDYRRAFPKEAKAYFGD